MSFWPAECDCGGGVCDGRVGFGGAGVCAAIPENAYHELRWRSIGPYRGGRTRAVAGVPTQPNLFYIGAVNGGVWKSDDYGRTWTPIFDAQPTQSIGAIAVAPSDPNIIYVASGEGLQRPDLSVGNGIYKSTDAGKTWTHLGLRDGQQIPALASRSARSESGVCGGAGASLSARMSSAEFFARRTAGRPGSACFTRMKIPAGRTSRWILRIRTCCMPACGKRGRGRGKTATHTTARMAGFSNPPMAAAPGSN